MKNYDFQNFFHSHYDKAVGLYSRGQRGADTFFTANEAELLAASGITAQHVYDYAEDHNNYDEPGYDLALGIEYIRRSYFLLNQRGRPSNKVLDETKMPPKTEAVRGIEWLPRIIPKAKAKLRGELPPSLMYCCGGDRKFFKTHDINPVEFLDVVRQNEANDGAIIDWVVARSTATQAVPESV